MTMKSNEEDAATETARLHKEIRELTYQRDIYQADVHAMMADDPAAAAIVRLRVQVRELTHERDTYQADAKALMQEDRSPAMRSLMRRDEGRLAQMEKLRHEVKRLRLENATLKECLAACGDPWMDNVGGTESELNATIDAVARRANL